MLSSRDLSLLRRAIRYERDTGKEGSGSLVEFRIGSLQCRLIKNVVSKCQNYVPDKLILHTAENPPGKTLGPDLVRSQSWSWAEGVLLLRGQHTHQKLAYPRPLRQKQPESS